MPLYKELFTYMKNNNTPHFYNTDNVLTIYKCEMNEEQIDELRSNIINSGVNTCENYNFIYIF